MSATFVSVSNSVDLFWYVLHLFVPTCMVCNTQKGLLYIALHKLPEKGRVLLNRETVAGEFRSKVKHLHRVLKPIVHGLLRNVSGFKAFHQVRAAHAAEEIQSSAFDLQIEAFGNGDSATRAEFRGVPEKVIECVIESCMHAPAKGSLIIFSGGSNTQRRRHRK
jgi:hypothetical protein